MKSRRTEAILTVVICLLPIVAGAILYSKLPEQVPTHFGADGQANGWSSRAFAVFGLPGLMALIQVVLLFALRTDPKKQNMNAVLRTVSVWTCPVLSVIMYAIIMGNAMGHRMHIETVVPLLVGLLFILIGNYLPKTKQSYTMGIKLPWTLHSEENWNRTHRLAGFIWVAGGILMVLLTLLHLWQVWLMLVLIAVLVLVPTVYSYLLYKKGI